MAKHEHMILLEDLKRAAWSRTSPVGAHVNAWEFRKDRLGNMVRYADFGNRKSPFGWELDFIEPKAHRRLHGPGEPPGAALARHRRPQHQRPGRARREPGDRRGLPPRDLSLSLGRGLG